MKIIRNNPIKKQLLLKGIFKYIKRLNEYTEYKDLISPYKKSFKQRNFNGNK